MVDEKIGGPCDFPCDREEGPMIQWQNEDTGHKWVCHISCLREQLNLQLEVMGLRAEDRVFNIPGELNLTEADLVKLRDAMNQDTLVKSIRATEAVIKELAER